MRRPKARFRVSAGRKSSRFLPGETYDKAMVIHVQNQILAHDCKTDEADIRTSLENE